MTYARHMTVTANGGMPGGERWSCTSAYSSQNTAWEQGDLDQFAANALARWTTAVQSAGLLLSSGVSLQRVDVRAIDTAGRTELLAQTSPSSSTTGSALPIVPNQVAVVVSLRTATPGPKGRGRFYLPCLQANVGTDGRLVASQRGTIAGVVQTLLKGLATDYVAATGFSDGALVVASGVGSGLNSPVQTMRVGDVFDTQRRRRDALVESYVSLPIPPA